MHSKTRHEKNVGRDKKLLLIENMSVWISIFVEIYSFVPRNYSLPTNHEMNR